VRAPGLPQLVSVLAGLVLTAGPVLLSSDARLRAAPLVQIGGETLDVRAEHLEVNLTRGEAVLEGQVRVSFGELDVWCDRVDIRYDEAPMVRKAVGKGNLRATVKGIVATADALEVEVAERRAQLTGHVRVSRGKGWIEAERATIDLPSGKVNLDQVRGSIPVVSGG